MRKILISAMSQNRVIGKDGDLPWHNKEEFQHFKNTTMGHPMIMGRKSFDSLGKPLEGRLHLVVTRQEGLTYPFDEVKVFNSLDEAVLFCKEKNLEKIFIIGGGEIFAQAIDRADEIILSVMKFETDGDTYFPEINEKDWKEIDRDVRDVFDIITYVRK